MQCVHGAMRGQGRTKSVKGMWESDEAWGTMGMAEYGGIMWDNRDRVEPGAFEVAMHIKQGRAPWGHSGVSEGQV